MSDDADMAFSCFNSIVQPPAALAGSDSLPASPDSVVAKSTKKPRRQRHAPASPTESDIEAEQLAAERNRTRRSPTASGPQGSGIDTKKSRTSLRSKKRACLAGPLPSESAHQRCVELADALIRALRDDKSIDSKTADAAVVAVEKPKRVAGPVALANLRYWREACFEASGKRVLCAKEHPELHAKAIELMKTRKAADQAGLAKNFASVDPASFSLIVLHPETVVKTEPTC